jgi:hypothetical protein
MIDYEVLIIHSEGKTKETIFSFIDARKVLIFAMIL